MENNLYYTPELKDLHYGFEFEYKSKDDNWVKVTLDTWNRPSKENHLKYFTEYDLLRTLNHQDMACKYADLTCIRVKYLDQFDIESLGWKHKFNEMFGENKYQLNNYIITSIFKNEQIVDISLLPLFKGQGLSRIFRGTIKNKSQLKFIMTCLGILE